MDNDTLDSMDQLKGAVVAILGDVELSKLAPATEKEPEQSAGWRQGLIRILGVDASQSGNPAGQGARGIRITRGRERNYGPAWRTRQEFLPFLGGAARCVNQLPEESELSGKPQIEGGRGSPGIGSLANISSDLLAACGAGAGSFAFTGAMPPVLELTTRRVSRR